MRPRKLIMSAFGPYANEEIIDFIINDLDDISISIDGMKKTHDWRLCHARSALPCLRREACTGGNRLALRKPPLL